MAGLRRQACRACPSKISTIRAHLETDGPRAPILPPGVLRSDSPLSLASPRRNHARTELLFPPELPPRSGSTWKQRQDNPVRLATMQAAAGQADWARSRQRRDRRVSAGATAFLSSPRTGGRREARQADSPRVIRSAPLCNLPPGRCPVRQATRASERSASTAGEREVGRVATQALVRTTLFRTALKRPDVPARKVAWPGRLLDPRSTFPQPMPVGGYEPSPGHSHT